MISPHPDDESLAAGILLQRAAATGAAIRIIYATDGEDNPWPQRLLEKRWRLKETDRVRWGMRRRREALAALGVLGLSGTNARFLGLPDQGLTGILLHDAMGVSLRIRQMIVDWAPTHLLIPSIVDAHPDHSALAVLAQSVIRDIEPWKRPSHILCYLVHGDHDKFSAHLIVSASDDRETAIKRHAIAEHWTQLRFSHRRFMAHARRPERFRLASPLYSVARKPLVSATRTAEELRVRFRFRLSRPTGPTFLYLVGHNACDALVSVRMQLPANEARTRVANCATSDAIGLAQYRGSAFSGELTLSTKTFDPARPVFAKIRRGRWFFDDGWIEIPSLPVATTLSGADLIFPTQRQ